MNVAPQAQEARLEEARVRMQALYRALDSALRGQGALISDLLTTFFAGGHVLMEGLPGLGKTHLAKGLAHALGLDLARIQCTPDLMPGDITGSEILIPDGSGRGQPEFRQGPLFAHLVLVDEINRATPKTQSALLEAMQEGQVTYAGRRYLLPRPFWVIATQNPIEVEGTYPLPEAQLDRFLVKLQVPAPSAEALLEMIEVSLDEEPSERLPQVMDTQGVSGIMALAREIYIPETLKKAAVDLILATQPGTAPAEIARGLRYGASPRGLQALLRTARVRALMQGRAQIERGDLEHLAHPCLRHRLLPSLEAELAGTRTDELLDRILDAWRRRC